MDAPALRLRDWKGWLAFVAVAVLCGASIAGAADTPPGSSTSADRSAAPPALHAAWGTWQRHRVKFVTVNLSSSKELLQLQMSNLLMQSGARLNAPVYFVVDGGFANAELDYSTLQPVDTRTEGTAPRVLGSWRPVRFQLDLGNMDRTEVFPCWLLYYFNTEILPTLDVRHVAVDLPCLNNNYINYHLAFEVFAPVPDQG